MPLSYPEDAAARFSGTLVTIFQTIRFHILEDSNLHGPRYESQTPQFSGIQRNLDNQN
jgi:hypothetical protein